LPSTGRAIVEPKLSPNGIRYRLKHGIDLNAPSKRRGDKRLIARALRRAELDEQKREREERARLAKIERERKRREAEEKRLERELCWKITALPLDQISNPWTAGRKARKKTVRPTSTSKPTAPTTSAVSASTACGGLKHGN
jgi:hypothetical protein